MIHLKQTLVALFMGATLVSCGSFANTTTLMQIQKGMTQEEISQLLGSPEHRRFNDVGEQWEYRSALNIAGETKVVVIDFADGRVTNMDSYTDKLYSAPPLAACPPNESPIIVSPEPPRMSNMHRPHYRAMNEKDFQVFYTRVKNKPFKDDQLEIVATGAINNYFTCNQCLKLLSIYTFDDDKLEILKMIAPRIVDRENYVNVINSLTFSSSQDKAKSLMGNRPAYGAMNNDHFQRLYNNVKRESFKDEQLEALAIGAVDQYFTCNQCIRLMSIFSFDDEKIKVVELLAKRIVDGENSNDIVNALSFISSQDRAKALLGIRGK